MAKKTNEVLTERIATIHKQIEKFITKHLDNSFKVIVHKIIDELAEDENSILGRGQLDILSAAIIQVIGQANYFWNNNSGLFNNSLPDISIKDINDFFKTNPSSVRNKTVTIRKLLNIDNRLEEFQTDNTKNVLKKMKANAEVFQKILNGEDISDITMDPVLKGVLENINFFKMEGEASDSLLHFPREEQFSAAFKKGMILFGAFSISKEFEQLSILAQTWSMPIFHSMIAELHQSDMLVLTNLNADILHTLMVEELPYYEDIEDIGDLTLVYEVIYAFAKWGDTSKCLPNAPSIIKVLKKNKADLIETLKNLDIDNGWDEEDDYDDFDDYYDDDDDDPDENNNARL